MYKTSIQSINEIVNKIFQTDTGKNIFRKYRIILEQKGGVEIDIVKDETIPTLAKIEFAENFTGLLGKFSFCIDEKELAEQLQHLTLSKKLNSIYCVEKDIRQISQRG